jgi:hypothetical protein
VSGTTRIQTGQITFRRPHTKYSGVSDPIISHFAINKVR